MVKASIIIFARPNLLSPALGPNGFAALLYDAAIYCPTLDKATNKIKVESSSCSSSTVTDPSFESKPTTLAGKSIISRPASTSKPSNMYTRPLKSW